MKKAVLFLLIAFLATASAYSAEPLTIVQEKICVVSSFEQKDFFTVYSLEGMPLWEVSFSSKVISWRVENDRVHVFSKDRAGKAYYLSCFEIEKGGLQWERPIFAPEIEPSP